MANETSGTSTNGGEYGGSKQSAYANTPSAGPYSFAPSYNSSAMSSKDFLAGLGIGLGYAMGTMQGIDGKKPSSASSNQLLSYFSTPVYGVDNTKDGLYGMPGSKPHNCPNCGFNITLDKPGAASGKQNIESLIQGAYKKNDASNKKYAA